MRQHGRVVVVGAGLGGLSAAIHLACQGRKVLVLEKTGLPGGKASRVCHEGFSFDTGPSLLTMPFVLRSLFEAAGRKMEDYLELVQVKPACRYFFGDGSVFEAPGSVESMREAIRQSFPGEERGFDHFMRDGKRLWEVSGPAFLFNRMELATLLKINPLKGLAGLAALRPRTLKSAVDGYFRDPRLRQLFCRYATYNGSDPGRAPATFNVISYVEMCFGSWHVVGGIYAIVDALLRLAEELGVELQLNSPVRALRFNAQADAIQGLELEDGRHLEAIQVVINADAVSALCGPLLAAHPEAARWQSRWGRKEVSGSGYVLLLAMKGSYPELACHNILFCKDYDLEFSEIFENARPLTDPTIYISAPCKIDASQAPAGSEAWFVLVNAPSLDRCGEWPDHYSDFIVEKLSKRLVRFDPENVSWQKALPPAFLRDQYGAWQGSIYGPSSNTLQSAFFRVGNRSPVRGLVFAGGSAHPGGGIPLVLTSGRLAAELLA